MMWSLLLSVFGCARGGPEAYANCTVTVVTVEPGWDAVQEEVLRYDGQGRLVEARTTALNSLYPHGVEALVEYEYEGACTVRQRGRHESPNSAGVGEERRECDEHGHVERRVTESSWEWGGESYRSTWGESYVNRHDDQDRLISVTTDSDFVTEYVWDGLCEEPAETRYSGNGFEGRDTRVCNLAGQGVEGEYEVLDPDGERFDFSRWRRDYDLQGRLLAEERDRGSGTDIFTRVDYTHDDPDAPGPTEMTTEHEGEVTQVVTYTYDCEG